MGDCGRKCKEMVGEGKGMKEKIAEIIKPYLFLNYKDAYSISYDVEEIADKVLALLPSLDGIEVKEKCPNEQRHWTSNPIIPKNDFDVTCPVCGYTGKGKNTGTITRQAE